MNGSSINKYSAINFFLYRCYNYVHTGAHDCIDLYGDKEDKKHIMIERNMMRINTASLYSAPNVHDTNK